MVWGVRGVLACLTGLSADLDNNRDDGHTRTALHTQVKGESHLHSEFQRCPLKPARGGTAASVTGRA